ncbi:hypothetical protein NUW54_g4859 [Trametes sanguinea]|uniref:Uncharacterized protein n=1 Tax=Trametes sanguinea TaxID=158606 RepID=A0ACC1PWQ1_9APHY|nr:hypothetical protein NUW54_g4859 [Trametes sanguinea]
MQSQSHILPRWARKSNAPTITFVKQHSIAIRYAAESSTLGGDASRPSPGPNYQAQLTSNNDDRAISNTARETRRATRRAPRAYTTRATEGRRVGQGALEVRDALVHAALLLPRLARLLLHARRLGRLGRLRALLRLVREVLREALRARARGLLLQPLLLRSASLCVLCVLCELPDLPLVVFCHPPVLICLVKGPASA